MEAITYLNAFGEASKNGQKLAKIGQEKLKVLKGKYANFLKTLVVAPATTVAPVNNAVRENAEPVTTTSQTAIPERQEVKVAHDNYKEVIDKFSMQVYEKSFDEKPLMGARKIRVNTRVTRHVLGLSKKHATSKLEDMVRVEVNKPEVSVLDDLSNEDVVQNTSVTMTNTSVNTGDLGSKHDNVSPSVDDYLQKDRPTKENGIIIQLTGDVENLKAETVKNTAILEQLEAKYNELKSKKAQRIKELEEEKLSYTATLEGLTEKIKKIQDAIYQEEQSLSGYSK